MFSIAVVISSIFKSLTFDKIADGWSDNSTLSNTGLRNLRFLPTTDLPLLGLVMVEELVSTEAFDLLDSFAADSSRKILKFSLETITHLRWNYDKILIKMHDFIKHLSFTHVGMKAKTLQILWHDRSPVFSADFEQILDGRLATCGGDNNVRIWKVVRINDEPPKWSFLQLFQDILLRSIVEQRQDSMSEDDNENIQTWRMTSLLRGASSELYDLTWSPDGRFILSACVDNTCRIYNVAENKCVHVMTDHQHFVQGVAWDPLYQFLATQSSDRSVIVYELSLSKAGVLNTNIIARHSKIEPSKLAFKSFISKQDSEVPIDDTALTPSKSHLALSSTGETVSIDSATHKSKAFRIFHDENLTSFLDDWRFP
ncbi:hypothetical protein BSLG_005644 [Batrachochytrium salamandrivorans]|nr:hypothetical protein BSLG_005644 [Batrachochytrium salamandrivorans]